MSDPLQALRQPATAIDPDPGFAADLRARLQRALLEPTGASMTTTQQSASQHALTPYLGVSDARRAIDWYVEVFDGQQRGEPYVMPDGSIGHAEVVLAGALLMLAEGPQDRGGSSFSLHLQVPDVDATLRRAVATGAELTRPPADYEYGRNGVIVDPFGHRWIVASLEPGPEAPSGRHGDVAYLTLGVPDAERAKAFYGAVLGWRFTPGSVPEGWQVEGVTPGAGMWGGQRPPELQLCYQVDDVAAGVLRVRAAGGQAREPEAKPYGRLAECEDDQGIRFQLWQP